MTTLPAAALEPFIEGAVDVRRSPSAVQPIRLPASDLDLHHPSLRSPFTAEAAAGIRLRFRTEARTVTLEVSHAEPAMYPGAPVYDLVLEDGAVQRATATGDGRVVFEGLAPTSKVVEIWLPPGLGVLLRGMSVEPDVAVESAPHGGPRWVVYGSSITHCAWVAPMQTWPAIAARALGWNLTCLGFNGGCHLDPLVARAIAALPADRFTLKLGINVHNLQTMRERTFQPLIHGFIATLRDAHPTTPITLISPIASPEREESSISTLAGGDMAGQTLVGDLSLRDIRGIVREAVEVRRRRGDAAIDYLDGRELLSADDVEHLPDGLHPDATGYALMAQRFVARFGGSGVVGDHSVVDMQYRMHYDCLPSDADERPGVRNRE